jgi:hypothetical protein
MPIMWLEILCVSIFSTCEKNKIYLLHIIQFLLICNLVHGFSITWQACICQDILW